MTASGWRGVRWREPDPPPDPWRVVRVVAGVLAAIGWTGALALAWWVLFMP